MPTPGWPTLAQGLPRPLEAPPRCSPGTSVAPPQSSPSGPLPPRALARQQSPAPLHAAPPPTPRPPQLPGPGTRSKRTPPNAQARPSRRVPSGGSKTCGMTSSLFPVKNKHAKNNRRKIQRVRISTRNSPLRRAAGRPQPAAEQTEPASRCSRASWTAW